jgi:hypothetical protein
MAELQELAAGRVPVENAKAAIARALQRWQVERIVEDLDQPRAGAVPSARCRRTTATA